MIQLVDYSETKQSHQLGQGQEIETVMANQVGTKIFRIYQPTDDQYGSFLFPRSFVLDDIDLLISSVRTWYEGSCEDTSEVDCYTPTSLETLKNHRIKLHSSMPNFKLLKQVRDLSPVSTNF